MPTKNSLPVKRTSLPSNVAPRKSASWASISTTASFRSDITLFTASACREEKTTLLQSLSVLFIFFKSGFKSLKRYKCIDPIFESDKDAEVQGSLVMTRSCTLELEMIRINDINSLVNV